MNSKPEYWLARCCSVSEQDLGKEVLANVLPSKTEDGFVSQHTPTPWHTDKYSAYIWGPAQEMIADTSMGDLPDNAIVRARGVGGKLPIKANVAFIVRACNAHGDLLAALQACLKWHVDLVNSGDAGFWNPEDDDCVKQARAAISKAMAQRQ